ncbi:MAG: hypothetical protein WBF25_21100 [Terriglobales bacterium]|jgi:hypothetical protein
MIGEFPIVTFDTSAHNRLVDDGALSEPILARIESGLWFRFAGLSVEELFATPTPDDRDALFTSCRRLQRGPSECLLPPNKLLEQLILNHINDPKNFNWKFVNVRWPRCEAAIRDAQFFADERVSQGQREFQRERKKIGKDDLVALRPKIQAIFEAHGEAPPVTFQPAISRLENSNDGRAVSYAATRFYDHVAKVNTDEVTVKEFMSVCPPLRALVYAIFVPWYNTAVRDYHAGQKLDAGNNDLFMSVYLPYCDRFVTNDAGQEKALREVAAVANLDTEVLSYDDFCASFLVAF